MELAREEIALPPVADDFQALGTSPRLCDSTKDTDFGTQFILSETPKSMSCLRVISPGDEALGIACRIGDPLPFHFGEQA